MRSYFAPRSHTLKSILRRSGSSPNSGSHPLERRRSSGLIVWVLFGQRQLLRVVAITGRETAFYLDCESVAANRLACSTLSAARRMSQSQDSTPLAGLTPQRDK